MIINSSGLAALFTGFKTIFNSAFAGAPSVFEKVAMVVPSTTEQETYAWLGTITRFREWLGDRVIQNLKSHGFTIRNKSFENTVGVDRDKIEDDTYGVYNPFIAQLGQDAKTHPDEMIFALLAAGLSTLCYDGQYFFDTDHPVIGADGSVQSVSNIQAGVGTPWYLVDATKAIKPLIFQKRRPYTFVAMNRDTDQNAFMRKEYLYGVDGRGNVGLGLWQLAHASQLELNATNFNAAFAAMQAVKGDNGKALGITPSLLVVPPTLRAKALEIAKAERDAFGATNINQGAVEVLVTPWLA
jgi:phage major head subunit gpT-like protein